MFKVSERVKAPNGDKGTILSVFENKPPFAEGCLVKFDDGIKLFMPTRTLKYDLESFHFNFVFKE